MHPQGKTFINVLIKENVFFQGNVFKHVQNEAHARQATLC